MDNVAPYSGYPELILAEHEFSSAKAMNPVSSQAKVDQAFEMGEEAILTGRADGAQAAAIFAQQATTLLGASGVEG